MTSSEKKSLPLSGERDVHEGSAAGSRRAPRTRFRGSALRITLAATVLVGAAFIFGGVRTGVMVLLPVLFALPCLLMLFMAMDRNQRE